MNRSKLLQENQSRAYREADEALKHAQTQADVVTPCDCATPALNVHMPHCAKKIVRRAIHNLYSAAHRAGQCREREKVATKLRSRSGPTGAGLVYASATQLVERMRFPR